MNLKTITSILNDIKSGFSGYKRSMAFLALLAIVAGLLEGIGIGILIPLFSIVTEGSAETDIVSRTMQSAFSYVGLELSVLSLIITIVILFTLKALILYFSNIKKIDIVTRYEKDQREILYKTALDARWGYLLKQKLGFLEKAISVDTRFASSLLLQIAALAMGVGSILAYAPVALAISLEMTITAAVVGAFIFLFFIGYTRNIHRAAQETTTKNRELSHYVNQSVLGMKSAKIFGVQNELLEEGKTFFRKLKEYRDEIFIKKSLSGIVIQPLGIFFILVVFWFSYKLPGFNIATFVVVMYLIQRIFNYIIQIVTNTNKIAEARPYLQNMLRHQESAKKEREDNTTKNDAHFEEKIEFNNVTFSYDDHLPVLKSVNLSVKKGEMVGIIGPSGSGKTTFVDIIARLFEPQEGSILVDGNNINTFTLSSWRDLVGYVSQDMFLFNGSVKENIRFYDENITDKDIEEELKRGNIYRFIHDLPQGLDTIVGERGQALSVGQRQRIMIARALVRKPKILILDEATSALDRESEQEIKRIIENLKGEITIFVIAHRLSTIANCDRLVVIENGSIKEEGSTKELLSQKDSYFYKVHNIRE
ncbi:hypothetical protein CL654_02855 [bacterium]|nr:hypothetical protein [bacterium]|tara:strand:- start:20314 stop:22092 length:1779 start_codon:yes stop_codon:yes gene_type:complete